MSDEPRFMIDTKIDVYRSGLSMTAIRLTHLPTGTVAEGETDGHQTQMQLKTELIGKLGKKLSSEYPCQLSQSGPYAPVMPEVIAEESASGKRPEPRHYYPYRVC